jgi:hypothetical protein
VIFPVGVWHVLEVGIKALAYTDITSIVDKERRFNVDAVPRATEKILEDDFSPVRGLF